MSDVVVSDVAGSDIIVSDVVVIGAISVDRCRSSCSGSHVVVSRKLPEGLCGISECGISETHNSRFNSGMGRSCIEQEALTASAAGASLCGDVRISSSRGLQIQSLLRFRLPRAFAVATSPSRRSSSAFRSAMSSSSRFSVVSESEATEVSSRSEVGMCSSSSFRKQTRFVRGKRIFGARVAVAESNRRGMGLFRRMLRGPRGKQ